MKKAPLVPSDVASGIELKDFLKISLVDLVAGQIRAGIFSGKYLPGQKLIVRELSEDLGVSHTPVKDALNRLTAEGLVEAFPGRSMVVRSFTNDELIESMSVRLMCELSHAAEIAANASENSELLEELESLWQEMKRLLHDEGDLDHERWVDCETRFHRLYVSVGGNAKLSQVYDSLDVNRFTYFAYLYNNSVPLGRDTYEKNVAEHREIIDALKLGDADKFARAAAGHVLRACDDYEMDEAAREKITQIHRMANRYLGGNSPR